jgi:heme/copper-type cytochrome/quinol oxidase subunit 2
MLPINTSIRLLVTSNDVIHSFAIPSLAIKSDAIPGRLNAMGLIINRPSTYYGQCSELCGVLHGFMPIGLMANEVDNCSGLVSVLLQNEIIL